MKKLIEIPSLSYQLFNQAFLALQRPKRSAASPTEPRSKSEYAWGALAGHRAAR
ncbi:MAG: hypothetical protein ACRC0C_12225 [Gibbsiella quercinecans]|uniref:hypothetical protein n=1 Tax=Gibbsiella quercinecans TaxID=929813 RepID=UPI003F3D9C2D